MYGSSLSARRDHFGHKFFMHPCPILVRVLCDLLPPLCCAAFLRRLRPRKQQITVALLCSMCVIDFRTAEWFSLIFCLLYAIHGRFCGCAGMHRSAMTLHVSPTGHCVPTRDGGKIYDSLLSAQTARGGGGGAQEPPFLKKGVQASEDVPPPLARPAPSSRACVGE